MIDKSTVIYNEHPTIQDLPLGAYKYVVNGNPAIEWVMERKAVTTDNQSLADADESRGDAKFMQMATATWDLLGA